MKRTLLMVDAQTPGGEMDAEPLVVETDGRLAVLEMPDGSRIAASVDVLIAALALPAEGLELAA